MNTLLRSQTVLLIPWKKVVSSFKNCILKLAVTLLRRDAASGGGRPLQETGTCGEVQVVREMHDDFAPDIHKPVVSN